MRVMNLEDLEEIFWIMYHSVEIATYLRSKVKGTSYVETLLRF